MSNEDGAFDCFGSISSDDDSGGEENGREDYKNDELDNTSTAAQLVAMANLKLEQREAANHRLPLTTIHGRNELAFEVFDDEQKECLCEQDREGQFEPRPSRGKGLRALRPYKYGDEILREGATLRIPNQQSAESWETAQFQHAQAVQTSFLALSKATQEAVRDLSCSGGTTVVPTPHGIYDNNAFQLTGESEGGLFLTVARINHSCRPNCNHSWRPDLQQMLVFASQDIAIGDELCTFYGPAGECLDTGGRRSYLMERFHFHCLCDMCREGNTSGGDDRMLEIQALQDQLSSTMAALSDNSRNGLANASALALKIDQCLCLLKEQGLGAGVFVKPLLHWGYQVCRRTSDATSEEMNLAQSYLSREWQAVKVSEGVDCPKAREIEHQLSLLKLHPETSESTETRN